MDTSWYYAQHGKQRGPIEFEALHQMVAAGAVMPNDLVWNQGMPQWVEASTIPALFAGSQPTVGTNPTAWSGEPVAGIASQLGYYAPPTSLRYVNYAGFWLRFLAYIVDFIVAEIAAFLAGLIIGIFLGAIGLTRTPEGRLMISATGGIVGFLIQWLYWALQESGPYQATLGKRLIGLRVTDAAGGRITFARATGRFFGKFVSAIILGIGFIMAGFTARKQALHDILADTFVVIG